MAIIGVDLDRENPEFEARDFTFWMPQFKEFINTPDGVFHFDKLVKIANDKIFRSIYGTDWELAMSYAIAHYLTLIGTQSRNSAGSTLQQIAGGGTHKGIVQSASVGGFNKSLDFSKTMVDSEEALFWNQTSYGSDLMALLKTKAVPSIFVVTSDTSNL